MSKNKNYGSKHNLEKAEEEGTLPKISGNSNFSNIMDIFLVVFFFN